MERLTEKISEYIQCNNNECRLSYCDRECEHYKRMVNKLAEYEDAEEQGLLLRLPCKVGDTIYLVDFEEKAWDEAIVNSIEIDTRDNRILINSDYEIGTWVEDNYVFYSKEEAEQALEQMKGGAV